MSSEDPSSTPLRRHRPFALYWVSRVSSTVALQMQTVAVGWQMYDLTRNPLDLGLVGLTQFIPAALFVLVAGHVADRYDRRTIIRICQLIAGLAGATLALGTAGGWMTRESLLAVVFVTGSARAFEQTTLTTLLPGHRAAVAAGARHRGRRLGDADRGDRRAGDGRTALRGEPDPGLCAVLRRSTSPSSILISLVTAERTATSREPLSLAVLFAGFRYMRHNPIDARRHHARSVRGRSSAACSRSCRCSPATCSQPDPGGSACCARRPASARCWRRSC